MRSYFWPFTEVQNGNHREVMRKMQKLLRTTDYADVTDTCSGGADADALQYGHAIDRALQIRVISVIRGWLYFRVSEVIRFRRPAFA